MLSTIAASIAEALGGKLIDRLGGAWEAYVKKEISRDQLLAQMVQAIISGIAEIEVSHSQTLAQTYASFMGAMEKSKLMQRVWASVAISQLCVLLWHQLGIPALCYFEGVKACYPSSGTTVEWAYLLLAACLGCGPVVLRNGPGKLSNDSLKSLIPASLSGKK